MTQIELSNSIAVIIPDEVDDRQEILTYIDFTGSERYCWDCGEQRSILIATDLNGKLIKFDEVCSDA